MVGQRGIFRLLGACCLVLAGSPAFSQVVATCSNPKGYAHYHYRPPVPKKKSGFQKDAITGGVTTLQRLENGEYDILIVDARKQTISYRKEGGKVMLLRRGASDATFLAVFPETTIELYTFYTDADGVKRFDLMQSRGGDGMPIHKSSVMTGPCSQIDLEKAK